MIRQKGVVRWLAVVFILGVVSGCANNTILKNSEPVLGHTLTIDSMGNVWASGKNHYGQLGLGFASGRIVTKPLKIPGLQNITQVYTRGNSSYAIDGAGYLYSWGQNDQCQLGNNNKIDQFNPVTILQTGLNPAEDIWQRESSGTAHKLEIRENGSLWASGNNDNGQLGQGNTTAYNVAVAVLPSIKFKSVYALNDSSRAISTNGDLYVWGDSLYEYMGYDESFLKPLSTPTRLTGVGDIQIIDIWNQQDTVPHTSFLPLYKTNAILRFTPLSDGGIATRHDGSMLVWGASSGSCKPVLKVENEIELEITNVSPYAGETITLMARVAYDTVKDIRFIVNDANLSKCKVPRFGETVGEQDCVFNDYINMAGLILEQDKPTRLKGLTDSFQKTVALTRYKSPNIVGDVEIYACATMTIDNREVCSAKRTIQVNELVCNKTDYSWSLYQPGKWTLNSTQINDIFRLDRNNVSSPWGASNVAEPSDSDLTQGIVNFLGRNINTMLSKIDLSEENVVMAVEIQDEHEWLPDGQRFHWNPIQNAWITSKKMADDEICVTHVSRDSNINFRTAERAAERVFLEGFKVPAFFADDPGSQTITTSQIYHVVVAGSRSRTSYISTSENFKWTFWVAGYDLGRSSKEPYSLYTGYTWNGLNSKVHTTRGDQAEISVPYSIAGHNIMGVYKLNRPEEGPFNFNSFTVNQHFYPQTIDYIE